MVTRVCSRRNAGGPCCVARAPSAEARCVQGQGFAVCGRGCQVEAGQAKVIFSPRVSTRRRVWDAGDAGMQSHAVETDPKCTRASFRAHQGWPYRQITSVRAVAFLWCGVRDDAQSTCILYVSCPSGAAPGRDGSRSVSLTNSYTTQARAVVKVNGSTSLTCGLRGIQITQCYGLSYLNKGNENGKSKCHK